MAETPGIRFIEIGSDFRHGDADMGQSSDGTGGAGGDPSWNTLGTLTQYSPEKPFILEGFYPGQPPAGGTNVVFMAWPIPSGYNPVFPADFAGSFGRLTVNPAASYVFSLYKNATAIGTMTISTSGIYTFSTGGTVISCTGGTDEILIKPPTLQDASLYNVRVALKGKR